MLVEQLVNKMQNYLETYDNDEIDDLLYDF